MTRMAISFNPSSPREIRAGSLSGISVLDIHNIVNEPRLLSARPKIAVLY